MLYKLEEKQLWFAFKRSAGAGTALRSHSLRLTGRRASPDCTVVCATVLLNLHDPKPSITGPQKGPGDRAQRRMQYANYIPFSIAAQPFPYPEYLNFSVLIEGMWYKACRHTVTGTRDAQKQVSWGSRNGWGVRAHPFQYASVHLCPTGKPNPPCLGDLDK